MPKHQNKWCDIPGLDFSWLDEPFTDEEYAELEAQIERDSSPEKLRELVNERETHPEHFSSWDMDISFDEFARRVKSGEYD